MKIYISLLLVSMIVTVESASAQARLFKDSKRFVAFPFDPKASWCFTKGRPTTLDTKELHQLSEILEQAAKVYNEDAKNQDFHVLPLDRYYFQLVAIINEKGEKEVWVNGMCEVGQSAWRENIVAVDDGGNCYFTIKINLHTKLSYELRINGYA